MYYWMLIYHIETSPNFWKIIISTWLMTLNIFSYGFALVQFRIFPLWLSEKRKGILYTRKYARDPSNALMVLTFAYDHWMNYMDVNSIYTNILWKTPWHLAYFTVFITFPIIHRQQFIGFNDFTILNYKSQSIEKQASTFIRGKRRELFGS